MNKLSCDSALVDWTLQEAAAVLETMGLTIVSDDGSQIRCSCPWGLLGTEWHSHGNTENPAYTVTIEVNQNGHRYMRGWCFGCTENRTATNTQGVLYDPAKDVKSDDIEELLLILRYDALTVHAADPASLEVYEACGNALDLCVEHHLNGGFNCYEKPVKTTAKKKGASGQFYPYPHEFLNTKRFPSAITSPAAMAYLHKRGMLDWAIEELDVRFNEYFKMVCFPYYAKAGVLAGVRCRSILDDKDQRLAFGQSKGFNKDLKHICCTFKDAEGTRYNNTATTWFRQSHLRKDIPIIICEGVFDAARIFQCWENSTAIFTQSINEKKLSFFSKLSRGGVVIFVPDNDRKADGSLTDQALLTRKNVREYFESRHIPFLLAELPDHVKDPASFPHGVVENNSGTNWSDSPVIYFWDHDPELSAFIGDMLNTCEKLFPYPKGSKQEYDKDGDPVTDAVIAIKNAAKKPPYWHIANGLDFTKPVIIFEQLEDIATVGTSTPNVICPLINLFRKDEFEMLIAAKEVWWYSKCGNSTLPLRLFAGNFFIKANIPFRLYGNVEQLNGEFIYECKANSTFTVRGDVEQLISDIKANAATLADA